MTKEQIAILKNIMTRKEGQECNSEKVFNNKIPGGEICRTHCLIKEFCNKSSYGNWSLRQAEAQRLLNGISIEAIIGEY